jgi:hypothetical protein
MATYDPPQPLWKRNLAGISDFLLVFLGAGYLLSKLPNNQPIAPPFAPAPGTTLVPLFSIGGWPALLLVVVIIAYFVIMSRTGGTIFQRLFGMKHVR